jgi:hypothetical protein
MREQHVGEIAVITWHSMAVELLDLQGSARHFCDCNAMPLLSPHHSSCVTAAVCVCRYDAARSRLQRHRPPAEVARQEALITAEWQWLRRVRIAAATAASSCSKQVGASRCWVDGAQCKSSPSGNCCAELIDGLHDACTACMCFCSTTAADKETSK